MRINMKTESGEWREKRKTNMQVASLDSGALEKEQKAISRSASLGA